jgi:hypothetical protein
MNKIIAFTLSTSLALASAISAGVPKSDEQWVEDERSIDGGATIYLNKIFSSKSGTFNAVPESMLDSKDKLSGSFIVGSYRYVHDEPTTQNGIEYDESISTEILECNEFYFGTLKVVKKLKGVEVQSEIYDDKDVTMMQTRGANMGSKLCALHAGNPLPSVDPKNNVNPSYRGDVPTNDNVR